MANYLTQIERYFWLRWLQVQCKHEKTFLESTLYPFPFFTTVTSVFYKVLLNTGKS